MASLQEIMNADKTVDVAYGKMIGIADVAKRLGVTRARVHALCKANRIPGAVLVGRLWMIPNDFEITPGARGPALRSR